MHYVELVTLYLLTLNGCVSVVINNDAGTIGDDAGADFDVDVDVGGPEDAPTEPPIDVFGPGPWSTVNAGVDHTCALRRNGSAICRGLDDAGETQVPGGPWISIAAGLEQSCGVHQDGTIQCWGSLSTGLTVPPPGTFTTVDLAMSGACALSAQGFPVCWGDPDLQTPPVGLAMDQISVGPSMACGHTLDDEIVCWGATSGEVALPDDEYGAVSVSQGYVCAITVTGAIVCDGDFVVNGNSWPGPPPSETWYAEIGAMQVNACALRMDGAAFCWGALDLDAYLPQEPLTRLSAGVAHACGITADDQHVRCWGVSTAWGQ